MPLHGSSSLHFTFEWLPQDTIIFEQNDYEPVDVSDLHLLDLLQKDTIDEAEFDATFSSYPFYLSYTTVLIPIIPSRLRKHIHSLLTLKDVVQLASTYPAEGRCQHVVQASYRHMSDLDWFRKAPQCPISLPCGLSNVNEEEANNLLRIELKIALEAHAQIPAEPFRYKKYRCFVPRHAIAVQLHSWLLQVFYTEGTWWHFVLNNSYELGQVKGLLSTLGESIHIICVPQLLFTDGDEQFWWLVKRRKQAKLAINRACFSFSQPLLKCMIESTAKRMHNWELARAPIYLLLQSEFRRSKTHRNKKRTVCFCQEYCGPDTAKTITSPCAIKAIYGSNAFVFTYPLHDITSVESIIFFNQI